MFAGQPEVEHDRAAGILHPAKPNVVLRGRDQKGYPASAMTQRGATEYCRWLSAKTGHPYRLPTEAEWEYACRAGTTTAFFWGADPAQAAQFGWFRGDAGGVAHAQGQKQPNPFGLYDIVGNVSECTLA